MSKYSTEKLLKKKRLRRYWKIALTLSFLIVFLYGVSFWSADDSVEIAEVRVSGNKYTDIEKVQQIFQESTEGRYFFLAAKRNFLLMPRSAIIRKIENELPVKSATIQTTDLTIAEIEIVEHEPWGLWCSDSAPDCYFVNAEGMAFVVAPDLVIDDLINLSRPAVVDDSENTDHDILGDFYTDKKVFKKFVVITDLLKRINIAIRGISTEDLETFTLTTKTGPIILIDRLDDPVEVVNNLKTTLEQESIHEIQFKNLEYIDLRFEGKAYYKIK